MTYTPPRLSLPSDAVKQLMDHNPWVVVDPMCDGPVNWRHMMAIRLRDVEIEPIIPTVRRLLAGMIEMTNAKVLREWPPAHDKAAVLQFSDWQERWLEHFQHWFDPIRNLFEPLCSTQDSYFVAEVLDQANGVVWCDFVLEVIDQFQSHREVMRRLGSKEADLGDRIFDRGPGQKGVRAFTLHALEQYQLFCMTAYIKTAPAPVNPSVNANFDNLFDCSMWEADDEEA
jgi:hypothetical protein